MLRVTFLRNIFLLTLLIACGLPLYHSLFIHPSYRNMLIEQTEQEAVRYSSYLINSLKLDSQQLYRDLIPEGLAKDVGLISNDRKLIKLRVFSPHGEIIFSTEKSEYGVINQKDYFVNIVAKGRIYSKVVEKDALSAEGKPTTIDVVETYVPVMGSAGFFGAIEVYYDISNALSSISTLTYRSNLILFTIALSLFTAIIMTLRRTYASHRARLNSEMLLVESNEQLEQRVLDRTLDLNTLNEELQLEVMQHLQTTNNLKKANEFSRTVINSMNDFVSIIDVKTHAIIDCNAVFRERYSNGNEEVLGEPCFKVSRNRSSPCTAPDQACPLEETVKTGLPACFEHHYRDNEGTSTFFEVSTSPILDDEGQVLQAVHVCRDTTKRKQAENEILQMAYYDTLTGLPNRRLLLDRLHKAIPQARRTQGKLAVLFLDLDRFKGINDSRGHSCGDQVLQAVAKRLEKIVRDSDTLARLGGDEFVILLAQIESALDASHVAEKVLATIREPLSLEESQMHITTSIGISVFPDDGENSDILLKGADIALYAAKSFGRNSYKFFSDKMDSLAQERHELESRMHRALEEDEFFLVYQPQFNLITGDIIGIEALLRWQNPDLGAVPPDKFIPVAEETGLILKLGDWVLQTACSQAKTWLDQGLKERCVAVNISVSQFRQSDFVEMIEKTLADTGLPAYLLELELTESLLMQNVEDNINVLQQLKKMGVSLSIDDFGTGYSSLSYLKNFPLDRMKIDQSFVRDINADESDRIIVETIIAMAERLGIEVIAEGVETESQRDALLMRNCHLVQGFLFGKPMSPLELQEFTCSDKSRYPV